MLLCRGCVLVKASGQRENILKYSEIVCSPWTRFCREKNHIKIQDVYNSTFNITDYNLT